MASQEIHDLVQKAPRNSLEERLVTVTAWHTYFFKFLPSNTRQETLKVWSEIVDTGLIPILLETGSSDDLIEIPVRHPVRSFKACVE
jgi:hypothetical protein